MDSSIKSSQFVRACVSSKSIAKLLDQHNLLLSITESHNNLPKQRIIKLTNSFKMNLQAISMNFLKNFAHNLDHLDIILKAVGNTEPTDEMTMLIIQNQLFLFLEAVLPYCE